MTSKSLMSSFLIPASNCFSDFVGEYHIAMGSENIYNELYAVKIL